MPPPIPVTDWADIRQTSAVTAAFNLLNSAAALAGVWMRHSTFLLRSPWWLLAVVCGVLLGMACATVVANVGPALLSRGFCSLPVCGCYWVKTRLQCRRQSAS